MSASGTPCESSSTVSFSGKRVARMRARKSSRSASGISTVNGRIVVSPADLSTVTAMWVLLGGTVVCDRTDPDRLVRKLRPSKSRGLLPGLHPGSAVGLLPFRPPTDADVVDHGCLH